MCKKLFFYYMLQMYDKNDSGIIECILIEMKTAAGHMYEEDKRLLEVSW